MIRSTDHGDTFADIGDVLNGDQATVFLPIPTGEVFCGTMLGDIYKSTDKGISWTKKTSAHLDNHVLSLQHVRPNPQEEYQILLAGTGEHAHIYRSLDFGKSWDDMGSYASDDYIKDIVVPKAGILVANLVRAGQVIKSTDIGSNWIYGPVIDPGEYIHSLYSPQENVILAGGDGKIRIYRSEDNGDTWEKVYDDVHSGTVRNFLDLGGGVIIAHTVGEILRSTDYGRTWEQVPMDLWNPEYWQGASEGRCKARIVGAYYWYGWHYKVFKTG